MGQGITPGAEPSSDEQKELEEFGEDGVGHLSPRCLMMVMLVGLYSFNMYIVQTRFLSALAPMLTEKMKRL